MALLYGIRLHFLRRYFWRQVVRDARSAQIDLDYRIDSTVPAVPDARGDLSVWVGSGVRVDPTVRADRDVRVYQMALADPDAHADPVVLVALPDHETVDVQVGHDAHAVRATKPYFLTSHHV